MLSFFFKLMLTFSALAPVALVYSVVAGFQGDYTLAVYAGLVCILTVGLCAAVIQVGSKHVNRFSFAAKEIEAADGENIGFMLLYLLPLFTDQVANLHFEVWLPALLVLGLLMGNGYAHHFNPLLGLVGWHFYKVTSEEGVTFILISQKRIASARGPVQVGQLTDNILFDLGGRYDHSVRVVPP